jgi:hypothetical protein
MSYTKMKGLEICIVHIIIFYVVYNAKIFYFDISHACNTHH